MKNILSVSGILFLSVMCAMEGLAQSTNAKKEAQIKVSDSKNSPQVVVVDSLLPAQAPKHKIKNAKQVPAKKPDVEPAVPPSKNVIVTGNKK